VLIALAGCVGNPWEQFQTNMQGYVGYDFDRVKTLLQLAIRDPRTNENGYPLPNGNIQREYIWETRNAQTCIVLFEVNPSTNKIVSVGSKGGTRACQWNG
jgi:hypothetical protein